MRRRLSRVDAKSTRSYASPFAPLPVPVRRCTTLLETRVSTINVYTLQSASISGSGSASSNSRRTQIWICNGATLCGRPFLIFPFHKFSRSFGMATKFERTLNRNVTTYIHCFAE